MKFKTNVLLIDGQQAENSGKDQAQLLESGVLVVSTETGSLVFNSRVWNVVSVEEVEE